MFSGAPLSRGCTRPPVRWVVVSPPASTREFPVCQNRSSKSGSVTDRRAAARFESWLHADMVLAIAIAGCPDFNTPETLTHPRGAATVDDRLDGHLKSTTVQPQP